MLLVRFLLPTLFVLANGREHVHQRLLDRYQNYFDSDEAMNQYEQGGDDGAPIIIDPAIAHRTINELRYYFPSLDTDEVTRRVENKVFQDVGGGAVSGASLGAAIGAFAGGPVGAAIGGAFGFMGGSVAGAVKFALQPPPTGAIVRNAAGKLQIGGKIYDDHPIFAVHGDEIKFYRFESFRNGGTSTIAFEWEDLENHRSIQIHVYTLQRMVDMRMLYEAQFTVEEGGVEGDQVHARREYRDEMMAPAPKPAPKHITFRNKRSKMYH